MYDCASTMNNAQYYDNMLAIERKKNKTEKHWNVLVYRGQIANKGRTVGFSSVSKYQYNRIPHPAPNTKQERNMYA